MVVNFADSPIISQLISILRNKETKPPEFRLALKELGRFMGYELAKNLEIETKQIESPLGLADYFSLKEDMVIIAILRAALPMAEGVMQVFNTASMGIISASREEMIGSEGREFQINVSYSKIPNLFGKSVIIVDPMLASGSTIKAIIGSIIDQNPSKIYLLSAIAAEYGVKRLQEISDLYLFAGTIDKTLNSNGYIVPGLGDAGDRAFATNNP